MTDLSWIGKAMDVASDLFTVGKALVDAVRTKDRTKADKILRGVLATTAAKTAADLRADEKFNPPG